MDKQPQDACDWVINDMDFRFRGAGMYGGPFQTQFYLDENCCFHREDGPAYSDAEGNRVWFRHGLRHREGGLPALECKDGERAWYQEGQLHRESGPAWRHADGKEEWWIRGEKLSDEQAAGYEKWLAQGKQASYDAFQAAQALRQAAEEMASDFTSRGTRNDVRIMKPPQFRK